MSGELVRTEFNGEQIDLIRRTICREASNDELALFLNRFCTSYRMDGECWRWVRAIKSNGYGVIHFRRKQLFHAHRVSYLLHVGPIPETLVIDHLCRNKWCVNPAHLEPVTKRENAVRGICGQKRTHCKHGHELTTDNVYVSTASGREQRKCRTCTINRSCRVWAASQQVKKGVNHVA